MKNIEKYLLVLCFISQSAFSSKMLDETGFYNVDIELINSHYNVSHEYNFKREKNKPLWGTYSPQYPLWTDGAKKRRWIYIPARGVINTNNQDRWIFPIGTKLWKELSYNEEGSNRKIETRYLEKTGKQDWTMETYIWNEAQTDAMLAPEEGIKDYYPLKNGKFYDIPSKQECQLCHSKAGIKDGPQRTPVLGFSALQLSDYRDPNAIHAEPLTSNMILLSTLQKKYRTSQSIPIADMPRIPETEKAPLQRAVFGYLHGNCGHCHNDSGVAETVTTLEFHHNVNTTHIQQNGTYKTALFKPIADYLQPAGSPKYIINPGNSYMSALLYRMLEENEDYTFEMPAWHHNAGFSLTVKSKMPILGSNIIDQEAIDIISEYIDSLRVSP